MKEKTMKKTMTAFAAMAMTAAVCAAEAAEVPTSVSNWRIAYPLETKERPWFHEVPDGAERGKPGIALSEVEVEVRGERKKALRVELTHGEKGKAGCPVVAGRFKVNAEELNILSFKAKVEVPDGLWPLLGDTTAMQGWPHFGFLNFYDDFGIAANDGISYPWAGHNVFATDFRSHDRPETRGEDGFTDFVWDILHDERTGFKGFRYDRVEELQLVYDTTRIPEGSRVVITICDIAFRKGAPVEYPEAGRFAEWQKRVEGYRPDYSDSSDYLEPPKEGRLGCFSRPKLVRDGRPRAEIVVALDYERLKLENFFTNKTEWTLEIRESRGIEVQEARRAAYLLQEWIGKITGAKLPVLTVPSDERNTKIYLGAPFAAAKYPEDIAKLTRFGGGCDGFAVRTEGDSVYIFGPNPVGTVNGVLAFLENNTDLIWAFPDDENGTVYTETKDLDVVWGEGCEQPAFRMRGWQTGYREWMRLNRVNYSMPLERGGFARSGGHYLSPQYYSRQEGMADFNPVVGGKYGQIMPANGEKRGDRARFWNEGRTLCCLNHPDFLAHACEIVPNVKELRYRSPYPMIVMGTDDNFGVCECELCSKPFRMKDGSLLTREKDLELFYSHWLYGYLNKMDALIQRYNPGTITSTFGYFYATKYPYGLNLSKNIAPVFCCYYRKGYNEPIYSPINRGWWKCYNDWTKHNARDLLMYDYYGLGLRGQPYAEVYQQDLKAMRGIGFLRTSTEGFGYNDYVGTADERWTMTRLAWNPDADVEQLHRYFNRRVYREAAPYMDRFRGVIRENYLKKWKCHQQLEDSSETALMILENGLRDELRGYLDGALAAARHPKSRALIERAIMDYDHWVTKPGRDYPSAKLPKPKKSPPRQADEAIAFTNLMTAAIADARAVHPDYAMEKFTAAFADQRVASELRREWLEKFLIVLIEKDRNKTAKNILGLWRANCDDYFKRANGWSRMMMSGWQGPGRLNTFARWFARRGDWQEVENLYAIAGDWDGPSLPVGLRFNLQRAKMSVLKEGARHSPVAAAVYGKALPGYLQLCDRTIRDGGTPDWRGEAMLAKLGATFGSLAAGEREAALRRIYTDRFLPCGVRAGAVKLLPEVLTYGRGTDWKRVVALALEAVGCGDWSEMAPRYYHGRKTDLRADTLKELAAVMTRAGRKDEANEVLGRCRDAITSPNAK